uniref:Aminotransferase-like plant mobile domain-containing protein n=1 Tax=Fagus sylvatica TaxID=28930 RepID=A0A2N9EII6_FAGSY
MTITLEDVSIQLGLPVDGLPVTGLTNLKWRELCIRLLGIDPPSPQLSGSRLSLNWLAQQFPPLATDVDNVTVERYAWMFPHIAPQRLMREHIEPFVDIQGQPLPRGSLGIRWCDDLNAQGVATHAVTLYRYILDRQQPSHVVWQPYSDEVIVDLPEYCTVGKEIWQTVAPLICFHIVEKHYPDRLKC